MPLQSVVHIFFVRWWKKVSKKFWIIKIISTFAPSKNESSLTFGTDLWCNGSTADFGSVSWGSNPHRSTSSTSASLWNFFLPIFFSIGLCIYTKKPKLFCFGFLSVVPPGIEPGTQGFSVLCSTDWAMVPFLTLWLLLNFCGTTGNRTRDTRIFSPLLYRLSYGTSLFAVQK